MVYLLIETGVDDYFRVHGAFKTEAAAWAQVVFMGRKKHSEIHSFDVFSTESFL